MLLINIDIIDIFSKNIDMYRYVFLRIFPITTTRHVIYYFDLGSIADSVKSKRGSGDTPTRRAWLCMLPHWSVVGAASSHVLVSLVGTLLMHVFLNSKNCIFCCIQNKTKTQKIFKTFSKVILYHSLSENWSHFHIKNTLTWYFETQNKNIV